MQTKPQTASPFNPYSDAWRLTRPPYPQAYHDACNHLVAFGGHSGDKARGRNLCAAALRALRQVDRNWAAFERRTMIYISGCLPVKS